jgi:hypothetical protein
MWLYVEYEPVTAFGLRPSNTTSNGGKSLVCPTPYAVKMGLLDRVIREQGLSVGQQLFTRVRDLACYVALPQATAVNRTFQRVLRPEKGGQLYETIAQREYCFATGKLELAFELDDEQFAALLVRAFSMVNYFGRKGSFMQWVGYQWLATPPPPAFINASQPSAGLQWGFLQRMDDLLPTATFEEISTFNPRASGGRRSYTVIFPYKLAYHGTNHTVYEVERQ